MPASTAPWFGLMHALTDALSLPVRFILTRGQAGDITQEIPLVKDIGSTGTLLADNGYDANALLDWLEQREIVAVIPPKANRKEQRSCDWHLYKERNVIWVFRANVNSDSGQRERQI